MPYQSDNDILALVSRFEERTLPKAEWTHQAHLTTALYYLYHHELYEAICLMKSRIITYNDAVGGTNSHLEGYHETLTVFWLKTIYHYLAGRRHRPMFELCNEFINSDLSSRDLPLRYYTREQLFSVPARATWLKPGEVGS